MGGFNMQITRGNYSQYANMVQQMFGNKKNPNNPLAQCDYGNFALRFKPVSAHVEIVFVLKADHQVVF